MAATLRKAPASSLADYVVSLSTGSRCFCCGGTLGIDPGGPRDLSDGYPARLCCPRCDSEVAEVSTASSMGTGDCTAASGARRTAA